MSLWFRDPFFGFNAYDDPFDLFKVRSLNRDEYMKQIDIVINNSLKKLLIEDTPNQDDDNNDIVEEYTIDSKGNKQVIPGKESSEEQKEKQTEKVVNKEKEEEKTIQKKDEKPNIFSRMSIFSNHSRGGIEEVHETVSDSNGVSTETHTKKIGDRWVRIEKKTDKDGTNVTKETWHNIDVNDHDKFYDEWNKRLGLKTKAIENKKD